MADDRIQEQVKTTQVAPRFTAVSTLLEWILQAAPSRAIRALPFMLALAVCGLYALAPSAPLFHRPIGDISVADLASLWPLVKDTAILTYFGSLVTTCDKVFALHQTATKRSDSSFA